ncbi:DedA family protein [Actinoplanes sp. CA-015351]|uniref:DedA family protein n=1 Tax=Actinoplanes sp. CA-015351 TaxID=3239897 RepID=UPI003D97617D
MIQDLLGGLPPIAVYLVVFALVTLETAVLAGLVLPSATALIAMGLLANAGVVPLLPALAVAVAAAILGGNIAFRFGSFPGLGRHAERTERLFARHGGRAVFFGQWVVGARTLMPRLAARNRVPRNRFLAWHTPAASLWALWMVGASYAAGASYDVLAARAGRATGALAALTVLILGLILAGRWIGQNPDPVRAIGLALRNFRPFRDFPGFRPHPLAMASLSLGFLVSTAALLVVIVPAMVRFSGLAAVDVAVAGWARGQWTSDGYLFALETATAVVPEALIAVAAVVSLARSFFPGRSRALPPAPGLRARLLDALGPVLPAVVFAVVLAQAFPAGWRAAETLVFPTVDEFAGWVPVDAAAIALATMSAGQTAQVAAAAGLLAWLVGRGLPWKWQVAVWTSAATLVILCAGSWVYLGWSRISETVAAVMLGVTWAALNAAVWSGRTSRNPEPTRPTDAARPADEGRRSDPGHRFDGARDAQLGQRLVRPGPVRDRFTRLVPGPDPSGTTPPTAAPAESA